MKGSKINPLTAEKSYHPLKYSLYVALMPSVNDIYEVMSYSLSKRHYSYRGAGTGSL
jgi:hypothetical protein